MLRTLSRGGVCTASRKFGQKRQSRGEFGRGRGACKYCGEPLLQELAHSSIGVQRLLDVRRAKHHLEQTYGTRNSPD